LAYPSFSPLSSHHAPLLFFFTLPPPPSSTLFPYTTLFRSRSPRAPSSTTAPGPRTIFPTSSRTPRRSGPSASRPRHAPRCPREPDRKSTRLNSSHDQISYAVFCLKKKKKKTAQKLLI